LLIEWPHGEAAPTKYWLSNVAQTISFRELVDIAIDGEYAPAINGLALLHQAQGDTEQAETTPSGKSSRRGPIG
jgi:hypothetical protein